MTRRMTGFIPAIAQANADIGSLNSEMQNLNL